MFTGRFGDKFSKICSPALTAYTLYILLRTRRANMSIQNGGSTGQKS
jgi:hypothetical protein